MRSRERSYMRQEHFAGLTLRVRELSRNLASQSSRTVFTRSPKLGADPESRYRAIRPVDNDYPTTAQSVRAYHSSREGDSSLLKKTPARFFFFARESRTKHFPGATCWPRAMEGLSILFEPYKFRKKKLPTRSGNFTISTNGSSRKEPQLK